MRMTSLVATASNLHSPCNNCMYLIHSAVAVNLLIKINYHYNDCSMVAADVCVFTM